MRANKIAPCNISPIWSSVSLPLLLADGADSSAARTLATKIETTTAQAKPKAIVLFRFIENHLSPHHRKTHLVLRIHNSLIWIAAKPVPRRRNQIGPRTTSDSSQLHGLVQRLRRM